MSDHHALDGLKQRVQQSLVRARDMGAHTWTTLKQGHGLERVRDVGAHTWTTLKQGHGLERVGERVRDMGAHTWTTLKERHVPERVRIVGGHTWATLKERHAVERVRDLGAQTWTTLKTRPWMGTLLAISGCLALSALIDAAELAVAMSAGVLAYQALIHQSTSEKPTASAAQT